ncbi:MAG: CusA/CzcA family heavy metal efflux RND transporter [Bacteroidales bacterium]|nr:CusA/CzcA family heavy metal efflux RND transporter [Bacteroidales bacterium]
MTGRVIQFSLRNLLIIGLLTAGLVLWGVYNFTILPIDAVPDITNNQVQVITISPSLAPQEVEQLITFPVEVAMANIQDVTEIRSVSRSGLSVVTVVFHDRVSPYLARQLVSEQIKIAEGEIPAGYGTPEMMPITTGLGEIYQYVLTTMPGYESVYGPMELRTIQDWIVKRFLSGIPGIVEISSFGGYLKQYEVSVKPRTLVEMDLTILEVFNALESNNQNSGGSYIEKGPGAYYIRAEGMIRDADDIRQILIRQVNGIPLTIGDVAEVSISSPPRFGAMTRNGKGEAVGGITLMLKGANTSQVIRNVKERVEEVRNILPEGIDIHPYLDRSRLISKTIHTVSVNLTEGGLIVIFVLVLLLGSLRAGLIVASVIPLSMLFAFSMMNLFGVSANLMSLGAIDFGLIVDGSVIMVEGIMHQLHRHERGSVITRQDLSGHIFTAGMRVGKSAVSGIFIILIVYIPILAFTGIEGKMFKPMAQTVCFALLGALLLSLTYVPMMSVLFLNRRISKKRTFSDRLVEFLQKAHHPVLEFSISNKVMLISATLVIVVLSFVFFGRLGGEFIPTLEEGDLAAQMTLSPGSSLTESIESSTKTEKILMDRFPEVVEVVSKIGTAEIPTDPMAIEDADIMIILKDKKEWTSAKTREELAERMKEALSVLPGLSFEFQQPIQLRFNELMTGVKSDVAVKIYGEDLDVLYNKATEAAGHIRNIAGAGDVRVEQAVGLPQLVIRYRRDQLARYGLDIRDINRIIRAAYAGQAAGVVFEGEARFDLVVRLCEECRNEFRSIQNLRISPPSGELILLSQVADITVEQGPMQISRDDTKRRITIGINIRNRDVESFVSETRDMLESKLSLPPGYRITYGGQFENLQEAKRSSSIAVPIALATILILLYFTFYSLRQSLMIFTAIPLAAVGGIWALFLRGMPFSISAGVGFIALFGIAVLNGIVLISQYNQLAKEGMDDIYERVRAGTRMRLRPVIMTASVAALGFVPMALSTAPGAEVQKPLATVVIGGLITATFLTMVVLPAVYLLFNDKIRIRPAKKTMITAVLLLLLAGISPSLKAQRTISLTEAQEIALRNNPEIRGAEAAVRMAGFMKRQSPDLPPLEIEYTWGRINSALTDRHLMIQQEFGFPSSFFAANRYYKEQTRQASMEYRVEKNDLLARVKSVWYEWATVYTRIEMFLAVDSLFMQMREMDVQRYEAGEISYLDKLTAETAQMKAGNDLNVARADLQVIEKELQIILNTGEHLQPEISGLVRLEAPLLPDTIGIDNPIAGYYRQKADLARAMRNHERMQLIPGFSLGYFNQTLDLDKGFSGWMVGARIPVWFRPQSGRIKAAGVEFEQAEANYEAALIRLKLELQQLSAELGKHRRTLDYYETGALRQSEILLESARKSYTTGEIGMTQYLMLVSQSFGIRGEYLEALNRYNQTVIEIERITGTSR